MAAEPWVDRGWGVEGFKVQGFWACGGRFRSLLAQFTEESFGL